MAKQNVKEKISFEVKKGIPLPEIKNGSSKYDWPFDRMRVKECFFVPVKDAYDVIVKRVHIYDKLREYRRTRRRFATRLSADRKSIGVWRIA